MNFRNHWLARYLFALLAVAAAFFLRVGLTQLAGGNLPTYITFYPAVMLSALLGGLGPGLLAAVAAALSVDYFILYPVGAFAVESLADAVGLAFFTGTSVFLSVVAELYRRARQQAAEHEAEEFLRDHREPPARWSRQGLLLNAGMIVALAILAVAAWQSARSFQAAEQAEKWVTHSYVVIQEFDRLISALTDEETIQRGYLLTGEDKYLEPYQAAIAEVQTHLATLKQLTQDNVIQQNRLARIQSLITEKNTLLQQNIALRRTRGLPTGVDIATLDSGKTTMDKIRMEVADAQKEECLLLQDRADKRNARTGNTRQALAAGSVLSFLLLITVFLFLKQENVRRTKAEAGARHHRDHLQELVAARTEELAKSNEQLKIEIDGHLQAKEALRQQREYLRVTLASIGDAVLVTDIAGKITFLNPIAESLTGWPEAEVLGHPAQSVFRIINEKTRAPGEDIVARVLREKKNVALANHTALLARDGREVPIEDSAAPIRDDTGAVSGAVLVFHDVTEKRRAQESLRESEERLRFALETTHTGAWDLNLKDHTAHRSLEHDRIFGYETLLPEWTYEMFLDHVLPEDRPMVDSRFRHSMETGGDWGFECRIRRADQQVRWIEAAGRHRTDAAGVRSGTAGTVRDITERKQADEAIREKQRQNEFLANIIERSSQAFGVGYPDGRLGLVNKAFENLTGYGRDELQSLNWNEALTPPEWREAERQKLDELARTGQPVRYEKEYLRKDGARVPIELLVGVEKDDGGNPLYYYSFLTHVTERKRAETAVRQSEARYRTLFDTMIEGFCIIEVIFDAQNKPVDYRFLEINPAFERQTGLHDAKGKLMRDLVPAHEAHWFELYGKVALTGEPARFVNEARALGRWFDVSAYRVGEPESRRVAILFNDITQSKRAELAREQLAAIVESSDDGILSKDAGGIITSWNAGAGRLLGYRPEEVIGRSITMLLPPDRQDEETDIMARLQAGQRVENFETVRLAKDGRRIEVSVTISPLKDAEGRVVGASKIIRDIAERKRAEEAIRQSETLLRFITDNTPDPIYLKDLDSRLVMANRATLEAIGKPAEAVLGKADAEFYDDPQIGRAIVETDRRIMDSGQVHAVEEIIPSPGGPRIFLSTKSPCFDANGRVTGLVGVSRDITDRKQKEIELQKLNRALTALKESSHAMTRATSEAQYLDEVCKTLLANCGHAMVWIGFAENDAAQTVRPAACAGFEQGYLDTLKITWADTERGRGPTGTAIRTGKPSRCNNMLTDPAFAPWRAEALKRGYASSLVVPLLAQDKAFGAITIYSRQPDAFSDDEIRLLAELADDASTCIRSLRAIAERQRAEQQLRLLSTAVESAVNGIAVTDRIGRILWINPAFTRMTGYSPAEAVGKNPRILKSGRHSTEFYRLMWSTLVKGENWHGELVNRRKDGSLYPEEMTIAPVRVDGADVTHYVAIKQDITIRKRAERRTELLAETASRLLSSDEPQLVVEDLCGKVLEFLDCQLFFNFLVDDKQQRLHLNACAGISKEESAKIEWLDFGVAVCGCAARDGCRIVAGNIQETPDPRTDLVKSFGVQAYACHPLMIADRLLGTLSFGTRTRKNFTEEELSFMKAVSDLVATAMERKRTQAALQFTAEEAKRSNRDLEQFAYIASHDLQEPLRAVGGYVRLIQRRFPKDMDPKAVQFINGAAEGADRMERLITDLLAFSRVGTHGGAFSTASLDAVLSEALRNLHSSIESAQAKVTSDALPTLAVDATQMMQIFQNLIGNAIKFHSKRPPEIHVSAKKEPGRWVFSVRDNGIGIEPQYYDRIFQIFQRLHTRRHYPGTGIGLAICKKMIERHDGAIWVESTPGQGSTFYFSLPDTSAIKQPNT